MSAEEFAKVAEPFIRRSVKNEKYDAAAIAALLQQRTEVLTDIPEKVDFFDELPEYGAELFVHKKSKSDEASSKAVLEQIVPVFESITDWNDENIMAAMVVLAEAWRPRTRRSCGRCASRLRARQSRRAARSRYAASSARTRL